MRSLVLVLIVALAGCTHSRDVYEPPKPAKAPEAAKVACKPAVAIPDRDLTEDEVTRLWGQDRAELSSCGGKNAVLVRSVNLAENP